MANLKDIHYSLNGEQNQDSPHALKVQQGVVLYPISKDEKTKKETITYPTGKQWYTFKLVDNTKSGGVYIPNIDDVWNPETGKVERIRLLSGVDSIWQKNQKEITPDYVKTTGITIEFPRGVKIRRVAAHDTNTLEFMRLSNSNVGNPKRVRASRFEFYEYDTAMAEKEQFEKEEFELEQAMAAKGAKLEPMRKHAAFLGINLINELGEPKGEDGIRREYVMYAKRNPQYFKDTLGAPQLEIYWLVKKAISETMIDIGREPGKAYWANGGGMIGGIPQSENPQTYLTELAMTNTEEGVKFKEQLLKLVS